MSKELELIIQNELKEESLPKIMIGSTEKKIILDRMQSLGFNKYSKYMRYCMQKEREGK